MKKLAISALFLLFLPACGIVSDKFSLDPGLDGCVTITAENFNVRGVHADKLNYHRINPKCADVNPHGEVSNQ